MAERKFDPEALREFQRAVREELLDPLEDTLMPMFKGDAVLGREPRWGELQSAQNAKQTYSEFHSTTWQSLEQARKDLYGMLERLDESIELHEDAEGANFAEQNDYEAQL